MKYFLEISFHVFLFKSRYIIYCLIVSFNQTNEDLITIVLVVKNGFKNGLNNIIKKIYEYEKYLEENPDAKKSKKIPTLIKNG